LPEHARRRPDQQSENHLTYDHRDQHHATDVTPAMIDDTSTDAFGTRKDRAIFYASVPRYYVIWRFLPSLPGQSRDIDRFFQASPTTGGPSPLGGLRQMDDDAHHRACRLSHQAGSRRSHQLSTWRKAYRSVRLRMHRKGPRAVVNMPASQQTRRSRGINNARLTGSLSTVPMRSWPRSSGLSHPRHSLRGYIHPLTIRLDLAGRPESGRLQS